MKKQTLRRFTVLSFLLMLTAVTVSAQSERIRVINIPFSFIVGQKTPRCKFHPQRSNRKEKQMNRRTAKLSLVISALVLLVASITTAGTARGVRGNPNDEPKRTEPVSVGEEAPDFTLEDMKVIRY